MEIDYGTKPEPKQSSTFANITVAILMLCIVVLSVAGTVRALVWMLG